MARWMGGERMRKWPIAGLALRCARLAWHSLASCAHRPDELREKFWLREREREGSERERAHTDANADADTRTHARTERRARNRHFSGPALCRRGHLAPGEKKVLAPPPARALAR